MHPLTTPERQFEQLLAREPSRPFVTYYDEATGERSELSVKSLANWVVKTHHLLTDELGLGVGDTALLALPAHWISVPIIFGCLTAGLALTDSGAAEVGFVEPATLGVADRVDEVYAVAPASAAVGFRGDPPAPAVDYVAAVRPHEDKWPSVFLPAGPDDPCLPGLSRAEVMARAAGAGLPAGGRLLTTHAWRGPQDWLATVLSPLAAGVSLVIVVNAPDQAVVARRAEQERVTARA